MAHETLSVAELRHWAGAVLDAVEAALGPTLRLEARQYWTLHPAETGAPAAPGATLGDLADDIADIRRDLREPLDDRRAYAWHTLDHFIGVLTGVSAALHAKNGGTA